MKKTLKFLQMWKSGLWKSGSQKGQGSLIINEIVEWLFDEIQKTRG